MTTPKKRYERRRDALRGAYRAGRITRSTYVNLLDEAIGIKAAEFEPGGDSEYTPLATVAVPKEEREATAQVNAKASPVDFRRLHAKYAKRNNTSKPTTSSKKATVDTVRARRSSNAVTRPVCGTPEGFSEHIRRREPRCQPCCDAIKARAAEIRAEQADAVAQGESVYQRPTPGLLDLHIQRSPHR